MQQFHCKQKTAEVLHLYYFKMYDMYIEQLLYEKPNWRKIIENVIKS